MHCEIDDLNDNGIKYPALYKSKESALEVGVVFVFDIENGIVYYIRLDGKRPAEVENCADWSFRELFTYFNGTVHLSN